MQDEIKEKTITVIAKSLGLPRDKLSATSTFEELGVDSLDGITILFDLEEAFEVEIPDETALEIAGIADILEKLESALRDRG